MNEKQTKAVNEMANLLQQTLKDRDLSGDSRARMTQSYLILLRGLADPDTTLEPLADRDRLLGWLWEHFESIPVSPDDLLQEAFLQFPVGTDRGVVLEWFEARHSRGVQWLLQHPSEEK